MTAPRTEPEGAGMSRMAEPDPEWDALKAKMSAIAEADPVVQEELYRWFTDAQNLGLINAALKNEVAILRHAGLGCDHPDEQGQYELVNAFRRTCKTCGAIRLVRATPEDADSSDV